MSINCRTELKEMLSEITASFSRNRCLWAEFTMPATNPGCKEEAMIHFLELGLYTHHYSLKFYINTLRLLSSFKCKFTFVNVKRKFEFCWFFGSPCALDGRVIGVFSGFYPGTEHFGTGEVVSVTDDHAHFYRAHKHKIWKWCEPGAVNFAVTNLGSVE